MQAVDFEEIIRHTGTAIDVAGVAVMVIGIVLAGFRYLGRLRSPTEGVHPDRRLRQELGRAILLGLELLVAGDIIRTVAIEPTFESVAVLGIIVLIRSFLSTALEMEISGKWPWQHPDGAT